MGDALIRIYSHGHGSLCCSVEAVDTRLEQPEVHRQLHGPRGGRDLLSSTPPTVGNLVSRAQAGFRGQQRMTEVVPAHRSAEV